jgi:hypothetical protein
MTQEQYQQALQALEQRIAELEGRHE